MICALVYKIIGSRVPEKGDFYISKFGYIMKCTSKNFSRRAERKSIVKHLDTIMHKRLEVKKV